MPARNISEYPQLLNAIHSAEKIVYLCGAGASMSLGSHRLSWTNWIAEGRKYLTIPEQNELNLKIGSWTAEELIDAATFLLGKLKSSGAYQTFMNQTIGALHPVNTEFKEALCKVWRAGDLIATTNYDTQIEETLNAKGVSYECPAEILSIIRSTAENKVIHLHGMYDERDGIDNIIADYIQYQTILRNSGAQFIQNLIGTNPIIIVGCGGTMEDPNLSGFMSFAYEKLGTSDIPYFYLMKSGDTIPNLPMNAIPVFYGDDYEDLPLFLSEIAMTRLQKRAGLQSVIAVNPYLERRTAISAFGRMHFSNSFNPFVGRTVELNDLSSFLQDKEKFLWRTILGEGGIGKSRLILEWMKTMPSSWFGFFAYKKPEKAHLFVPFADTVVAFDYVLGQEQQCADTIAAFIEAFSDSPYKLRIVLLERHQRASEYDWLIELKRKMPNEARLEFEAGTYSKPVLTIGPLDEKDEASYIENYAERFAKLVKSNSVMGFVKFISLALDDWPESDVFQKIAITPPDEELNDSEYYLGLMSRISAIKDIAAVEDVLLEREPIFQRYELELWRRIAIVLTDRGDIRRLYNSGLKYIRFLKEISEKVTIRDEAVDAIEAYCVGLHNAEAVDEYGAFLKKCGELTQLLADNKRIAVICCQNYGRLMHLRLYKNVNAEIQEEWNAIVEILKQCNYDEDVYKNVLDAVEEYFRTLVQRKKEDKLFELERFMAQVYEENGRCEAAEVAALCLANLYNSGGHRKITPDEYETIKKYLQKFPESMHIRAAFIIASEAIYSPSAEYKRVPDKIINKAKQWSEQYPKKIEFQEAYFGLLFSRLKYAQAQDMRNEQRRVYREMKTVAERANYSEYNESNQLMESVDILHRVFGY